eukprot:TRINITY_DN3762_c0_g6_i1.p1 TRINITY_DN3762_c0_g6~~TRINITY_DN3762_c0_g6_i1.p1  ORF type:complete len:343 (-),score=44.94 TRINITY_DN3762_c0_g6_i1:234-1262(-)
MSGTIDHAGTSYVWDFVWLLWTILTPATAIAPAYWLHRGCEALPLSWSEWSPSTAASLTDLCHEGLAMSALQQAFWLSFILVAVVFWISNLVMRSCWIIDPYWQFVPPLLYAFYATHKTAAVSFLHLRPLACLVLTGIWGTRLLYNYFRREEWRVGIREDWRFAEFRKRWPWNWWWMSFFMAFFDQQLMLYAMTLPYWAAFSADIDFAWTDALGIAISIIGITVETYADYQLRQFVLENERRKAKNQPVVPLLESGLWYYSRHPNYFGEISFWWGIFCFSIAVDQTWTVVGALTITSLFVFGSIRLTESYAANRPHRAKLYAEYQKTTSALVPWFKFKSKSA